MTQRIWPLGVLATAAVAVATGAALEWLRYGPYPAAKPYELALYGSAMVGGGPLLLLATRWRRRDPAAWPTLGQAAAIVAIAFVVSIGAMAGAGAVAVAERSHPLRSAWVFYPLFGLTWSGLFVATGALTLCVAAAFRWGRDRWASRRRPQPC
jgi:hypothetical protein